MQAGLVGWPGAQGRNPENDTVTLEGDGRPRNQPLYAAPHNEHLFHPQSVIAQPHREVADYPCGPPLRRPRGATPQRRQREQGLRVHGGKRPSDRDAMVRTKGPDVAGCGQRPRRAGT